MSSAPVATLAGTAAENGSPGTTLAATVQRASFRGLCVSADAHARGSGAAHGPARLGAERDLPQTLRPRGAAPRPSRETSPKESLWDSERRASLWRESVKKTPRFVRAFGSSLAPRSRFQQSPISSRYGSCPGTPRETRASRRVLELVPAPVDSVSTPALINPFRNVHRNAGGPHERGCAQSLRPTRRARFRGERYLEFRSDVDLGQFNGLGRSVAIQIPLERPKPDTVSTRIKIQRNSLQPRLVALCPLSLGLFSKNANSHALRLKKKRLLSTTRYRRTKEPRWLSTARERT